MAWERRAERERLRRVRRSAWVPEALERRSSAVSQA